MGRGLRQWHVAVVLIAVALVMAGCGEKKQAKTKVPAPPPIQPPVSARALTAPQLIAPPDQAVLRGYPRTTVLRWTAVPGAAGYGVEVDCYGCCEVHRWCTDLGQPALRLMKTQLPEYTFDFVGDQPGRWRAWAVAGDGARGPASDWVTFTYGRVIGGNIIPPVIPAVSPS